MTETRTPPSGTATVTVTVLGTGIMGAAMARNLARAGLSVTAWNRSREKAEPLAADGVRVADTPADAVRGAGIVLTMLRDGPATLDAMRAAAPALEPGTIWAQSGTVGLEGFDGLAAFAHEHGLTLVDAPVLGSKQPAEDGKLTVLAAGPEAARKALEPVFAAIGSRTVRLGDDAASGTATRLKLVINSWVLAVTHGTAEALALAEGLGVDPAGFLDAVAGGPLDMGYLRAKAALLLGGDLTPSFTTATAEKDARLIVAAGQQAGVRMDVAAAGAERFRRATEQGHGEEDMAASYYASFDAV
ncbi:NAD-binding protein [Streptomyces sp. NRRL B-1677]|uniref:NAD(P)-dependent oxidoreductase n=1 Tax=Streptomyces TaxID=1883 RepID=UPI001892CE99|nr:NAD(P)-dependent oxidoreductase [Streptomyces sp. NRRL B-1677]MBF6048171.1 NAD-binding protein [Streptomyces sp. NRRL B-1677]